MEKKSVPMSDDAATGDRRLVDLLVDGELDDAARKELLARLEDQPGGWRKCALAFLEAQSWGDGLRDLPRAQRDDDRPRPDAPSSDGGGTRRLVGTLLTMAACFLLAFWMGRSLQQSPSGGLPAEGGGLVDSGSPGVDQNPGSSTLVSRDGAEGSDAPPDGTGTVFVRMPDENGGWREVPMPVVQGGSIDPEFLAGLAEPVPPQLLRELEKRGQRVTGHERRLVPVQLDDGREAVFPVDQFKVEYVGGRGYQ